MRNHAAVMNVLHVPGPCELGGKNILIEMLPHPKIKGIL